MVEQRETFVITRASRIVLGCTIVIGLCAAVAASPIRVSGKNVAGAKALSNVVAVNASVLRPLGEGPVIDVRRSFGRNDEDCVTVSHITGPDGRIYATRGMICPD